MKQIETKMEQNETNAEEVSDTQVEQNLSNKIIENPTPNLFLFPIKTSDGNIMYFNNSFWKKHD